MKPDHPDMVSLRSRIDELDRQIARETSQVAGGRINALLAEYRAAASAERALAGRVAQLKGAVLDLRGRSIQYNILQREVDTNRASMTRCCSATRRSGSPAASAPRRFRSSTEPTFRAGPTSPT